MPVMMTNTPSLEEQVLTIAQTLEELMKSMKEWEALRDTQITFWMNKMGNTAGTNRADESFQSKQNHNDKPEGSTKDLKLSANGSISPDQLKELIKEAIKDQVGGGSQSIDSPIKEKEAKPIEEKETKQTKTSTKERKHEASKATKAAPVLHYVPIAKRKESQYLFSRDKESISKDLQGLNLPVTKITKPRPSSQLLKGFTRPSQGPIVEHGILPTKRIEEGFNPNAYRFMAKAGYNHE
nr:hypothetical protein CFP56_23727 [Quercus suber]POE93930.1 hypothetical protein CFP56_51249 [Quercus suber]